MGKWRYSVYDEGNDFNYEYEEDYMIDTDTTPSAEERIKALEAELAKYKTNSTAVIGEVERSWPKRETVYIHGSKEQFRELGERIGLEGEALQSFKFAFYEVKIVIDINQDGSYKIVEHTLDNG